MGRAQDHHRCRAFAHFLFIFMEVGSRDLVYLLLVADTKSRRATSTAETSVGAPPKTPRQWRKCYLKIEERKFHNVFSSVPPRSTPCSFLPFTFPPSSPSPTLSCLLSRSFLPHLLYSSISSFPSGVSTPYERWSKCATEKFAETEGRSA